MIYPQNFEQKIGFDQIRQLLKEKCLSTLGEERVMDMAFSDHFGEVAEWSIAAVLKTVVLRGTRGSNPCLSAERAGQKWSANGQKATNQ